MLPFVLFQPHKEIFAVSEKRITRGRRVHESEASSDCSLTSPVVPNIYLQKLHKTFVINCLPGTSPVPLHVKDPALLQLWF